MKSVTLGALAGTLLFGGIATVAILTSTSPYDVRLMTSEQVQQRFSERRELTFEEHQEQRKYAVIINGDTSALHKGNVTEAYHTLRAVGYADENIFLFTSNFPRGSDFSSITTLATKESVELVLTRLEDIVDENDTLLVYTTGHGNKDKNGTTVVLDDAELSADRLRELIENTRAGKYIVVADQCFSGGIVAAVSSIEGEVAAYSSTDADHTTYCKSFARPFWESFKDSSADSDGDGTVELEEAFDHAAHSHLNKDEEGSPQKFRSPGAPNEL
ncbi:caspase family protein [Candidatus Woesearchaeota archaeon]|nr:caspase family protein [Candidatus Woesearchaeota archaeon]